MEAIFKIDDKVDFVNDFGVIFRDKTITGVELTDEGYRYHIIPTDSPWFLSYEKNLHHAGTYKAKSFDLELNNGKISKFSHYDDSYNKVYVVQKDEQTSFNAILLDNETLYSISDYDEPISPLDEQLQPIRKTTNELQ